MEGSVISDAAQSGVTAGGADKTVRIQGHYFGTYLTRLLDHIKAKLDCREIDGVVVKGKDRPVRIFEVIDGEPPEIAGLKLDSLPQFMKGQAVSLQDPEICQGPRPVQGHFVPRRK